MSGYSKLMAELRAMQEALGGGKSYDDETVREVGDLLSQYNNDPFLYMAEGTEPRARYVENVANCLVLELYNDAARVFSQSDTILDKKEEAFLIANEILAEVGAKLSDIGLREATGMRKKLGKLS